MQTTYNERYEKDDMLMNFVTNHDENSWNGTIQERMGIKAEMLTALSYVLPGMPLIYSGQEYDLNHRLKFFEKDSIPKTKGKTFTFLTKLGALKNTNSALNGGKEKAIFEVLKSAKDVFVLKRAKGDKTLLYLANFSDATSQVKVTEKGIFRDLFSEEKINLNGEALQVAPLTFKIIIN